MPVKRKPASGGHAGDQAGFVARLQIVVAQWPSADRLAKATGVSPSAFRKWLKGDAEPSRDRLVALAAAAGVNIAWLALGDGPEPNPMALRAQVGAGEGHTPDLGTLDNAGFLVLPKVAEAAAAGSGHQRAGGATEFIGFRHDWLRSVFDREPQDIILETAVGESMEPHIHNGDLLLVDTTDRHFRNFGIYVIEARGERMVKRVQRKFDGSLILISDNRMYEAESIPADLAEEVHVVGRVIWRGGVI